ncbi:hypothetical protein AAK899_06100 [Erysipelotrichaceae bacterium 51-3]
MNESNLTFIFDSRGTRKLLAKNPQIKSRMIETITRQAENDFFKCKLASRRKWQGISLLECRVNDPSVGALRVAFGCKDQTIYIVYATTTILKKDFSQELDSFLKDGSK